MLVLPRKSWRGDEDSGYAGINGDLSGVLVVDTRNPFQFFQVYHILKKM